MAHIRRPGNRIDPYGAADNDQNELAFRCSHASPVPPGGHTIMAWMPRLNRQVKMRPPVPFIKRRGKRRLGRTLQTEWEMPVT
jgi:hypothetical protein